MRNIEIAPGEHYHLFNRGVNKQLIFHDNNDRMRFLFLILYTQSPTVHKNINRLSKSFLCDVQHSVLHIQDMVNGRFVELVTFCMMPNHFHLIVKEVEEDGIAKYMQRVLNAYTKYYNTKYEKSGHLFQGPYRAVHIGDDRQLLYLSAYIHRNPVGLKEWRNKEKVYTWSSCQDFVGINRFAEILKPNIIIEQFKNPDEYSKFLDTSTAKILKEELGDLI
jgi:putative transposase